MVWLNQPKIRAFRKPISHTNRHRPEHSTRTNVSHSVYVCMHPFVYASATFNPCLPTTLHWSGKHTRTQQPFNTTGQHPPWKRSSSATAIQEAQHMVPNPCLLPKQPKTSATQSPVSTQTQKNDLHLLTYMATFTPWANYSHARGHKDAQSMVPARA